MISLDLSRAAYSANPVVNGITLNVSEGDLLLLVGGNASGKSTCLKAAVGLVPLVEGTLRWRDSAVKLAGGHRVDGVSYMPQGKVLFPSLSVKENLQVACFGLSTAESTQRLREMREAVPRLASLEAFVGGQLSGGQRQLVGLVMALMRRPRLALLDEPCAGLDAVASLAIRELIQQLQRDWHMAVIVAEHRTEIFAEVATNAVALRSGRVVFAGDVRQLDDAKVIEQIFGLK